MVHTDLCDQPLPPFAEAAPDGDYGSEIIFHGRVRGVEKDEQIVALFYEHYEGMAQSELAILAQETAERFGIPSLSCLHRVGEIPVGESSVRIVMRSPHRAEGLEALAWFIRQLKQRVPIWKWGVRANGERFPSPHCEGCEGHEHNPD